MVAISLYRGNLRRVPDVPRRWAMPTPKISLKDFKFLLHRRSKALHRLHSTTTTIATTSNPDHIPSPNPNKAPSDDVPEDHGPSSVGPQLEGPSKDGGSGEVQDQGREERGPDGERPSGKGVDGSDSEPGLKHDEPEKGSDKVDGEENSEALRVEKPGDVENPNVEASNKEDPLNEREKRKREVEDKLQVLNATKHNLVQVLKQILNAEEELKRRNTMQGMAIRPSVPLQGDAPNDSGSMTKHVAPRMGLETNLAGDMEGGEADDVSNHNMHSRHLFRMSSTSPSSESPLRRPAYIQHNAVPHPSRANLVVTGSPSRFAPAGHPGHPANLPAVSVSGTNYVASSPSPAASGGTSAFRDTRLPSPWN